MELVSVNLTTYNRANLLPRALESVLGQTYAHIEVVIVDDCSTDNTEEVAKSYQRQDPRIHYLKHSKNSGNAAARNTALQNSGGYYVAFMDDDDEWIDPDKLKKQVALFEEKNNNVAIVCSGVRLHSTECDYSDKVISPPENIKSKILQGNGIIYSPTVLTKKSIMQKVGGFDENMPRGVDSEYYRCCIVKGGYKVIFAPDITTAVHEYGDDRMTIATGREQARKVVKANAYLLKKYFFYYIFFPQAFWSRFKAFSFAVVRLLFPKR